MIKYNMKITVRKTELDSNKLEVVEISISVAKGTGIYTSFCHQNYVNVNVAKVWKYIKNRGYTLIYSLLVIKLESFQTRIQIFVIVLKRTTIPLVL